MIHQQQSHVPNRQVNVSVNSQSGDPEVTYRAAP